MVTHQLQVRCRPVKVRRSETDVLPLSHPTNSLARTVLQAPYSVSATELRQQLHWLPIRKRIIYKLAVVIHKTRSTGAPAYPSQLIRHYQPTRTLRLSDKLLIFVLKMTLALSAKAFTVSAPSIWNSLSYKCRSAELLSTFKHTEMFDIAYSERLCHYAPLIRLRHTALYKCFFDLI